MKKLLLSLATASLCTVYVFAQKKVEFKGKLKLEESFIGTMPASSASKDPYANIVIEDVIMLPDGKMYVYGNFENFPGTKSSHIVRLNADGTIDQSFKIGTGTDGPIDKAVLQADGKLVIFGKFNAVNGAMALQVARLQPNGQTDASLTCAKGGDGPIYGGVALPDGKIIIGGSFSNFNSEAKPGTVCLNENGTFATQCFDMGDLASSTGINTLVLMNDGGFLMGGEFYGYEGKAKTNMYLNRYRKDCSHDLGTKIGTGPSDAVSKVLKLNSGQYLVSGRFTKYNGSGVPGLVRVNADLSLDKSFDPGKGTGDFDVPIEAVAEIEESRMILGGNFNRFNEKPFMNIVCVDRQGKIDKDLKIDEQFDGAIKVIKKLPGRVLLIAGSFQNYGDKRVPGIAKFSY